MAQSLLYCVLFAYVVRGSPPLGFTPNIVIFYADDFGWGDIEGYGHPTSITPRLDELIRTGTKLTSFYSASPVCSPSRAALLTGRFPTRNGVWGPGGSPLVFYQASIGGLPHSEITIPEFLKMNGLNYSTGIVGKWHLGIGENQQYLPMNHGFDFWTGLPTVSDDPNPPYCFPDDRGCWPATPIDPWNDTCPDSYPYASSQSRSQREATWDYELYRQNPAKYRYIEARDRLSDDIDPKWYTAAHSVDGTSGVPPNPLFLNNEIIQQPVNITMTPDYYTSACLNFISSATSRSQPFFLYMAFHQTHHPQFASPRFFNTSQRGMFGDAMSEMDYNIGVIVDYLKSKGIENETFVFFSSDNGPALMRESRGGSPGLLKCGKGTTYEGGVRVPAVAWMPKYIEAGRVSRGLGSMMDVLPTIAELVDKPLPTDRYYDGVSMYNWLFKKGGVSARNMNYYWPKDPDPSFGWQQSLHAVRMKQWKLHWIVGGSHCNNDYAQPDCRNNATEHVLEQPLLFNLYHDVSESYPVEWVNQSYYTQIVENINTSWSEILKTEGVWAPSQINMGSNNSLAPCCNAAQNNCYPSNDSEWPNCCVCNKVNDTFPLFAY